MVLEIIPTQVGSSSSPTYTLDNQVPFSHMDWCNRFFFHSKTTVYEGTKDEGVAKLPKFGVRSQDIFV